MVDLNYITVQKKDIVMRPCAACGTTTAHVGKQDGLIGTTCLQCLVDGGNTAASFVEWNRWIDPKSGAQLAQPRGAQSA